MSTVQSNIPGLVMSAPDVLVGDVPTPTSDFPWLLVILAGFLLLTSNKRG